MSVFLFLLTSKSGSEYCVYECFGFGVVEGVVGANFVDLQRIPTRQQSTRSERDWRIWLRLVTW